MSDFVIQFGCNASIEVLTSTLRDRPGMANRRVMSHTFPWGSVVAQDPPVRGLAPLIIDDELWCCAGRPRFMGKAPEAESPSAMLAMVRQQWLDGGWRALFESLSGMYVIARCAANGVDLLTDQMGFRPAYVAMATAGKCSALGTLVDAVAKCADDAHAYDLTSLAELLLYQQITFPYTSREGVRELSPASHTEVNLTDGALRIQTTELWKPEERADGPSDDELMKSLQQAMIRASEDVTRGCRKIASTLSGGWDSRATLAVLPKNVARETLTFRNINNRETQVARQVARAAGVESKMVTRRPGYFERTFLRAIDLLGLELRANSQGYCIVDDGLADHYDVIIGGQLCDTFLKDHFVGATASPACDKPAGENQQGTRDRTGQDQSRAAIEATLDPQFVRAVHDRRALRLADIRRIRPHSAEVWQWFWPASRQNDAGHNLGNSRLYPSDSLFMHRDIVNYAAAFPQGKRNRTEITRKVFLQLFGPLGNVPLAETGRPPSLVDPESSERPRISAFERCWRKVVNLIARRTDIWNTVEGSWVSWSLLQQHSPDWSTLRTRVTSQAIPEPLEQLCRQSVRSILAAYQPQLGTMGNLILMQMAVSMQSRQHQQGCSNILGSRDKRDLQAA